ncbi:glycine cleavage system protein [Salix suchowensis]|nr:glycine cleavage system protein [Salix suchowensis]
MLVFGYSFILNSLGVLKDFKYAGSHEWVKVDGKTAIVGITNHAQDYLGDAVYVELPEVGAVESAKATSDVYYLVSGDMVKVNEELNNSYGLLHCSKSSSLNCIKSSSKYKQF